MNELEMEGAHFANYLLGGTKLRNNLINFPQTYADTVNNSRQLQPITRLDKAILDNANHRILLSWLDCGMPFFAKNTTLRARLYLVSALLESSPGTLEFFDPKPRSFVKIIGFLGLQAIKLGFGIILGGCLISLLKLKYKNGSL